MSKVIHAPEWIPTVLKPYVFLAGSIEMGVAENWQDKFTKALKKDDVVILNPRRPDWDSSWKQSIDDPKFSEQVLWELDALDMSDVIALYFDPNTKSPISLLELGLYARTGKVVVCCPEGFWRKGNVDIVVKRYGLKQVETIEELIKEVQKRCINFSS